MLLTNENWLEYAFLVYDTHNNMGDEIYDDLKQIQNLKKYFNFYLKGNHKFVRQIINTIIILNNNFTVKGAFNLILFKLDTSYYPLIKTCYYYLKLIDKDINTINIYACDSQIIKQTNLNNQLLGILQQNI